MKTTLDLKNALAYEKIIDLQEVEITGITTDSRQVKPGYLFICLPGHQTDGHRYAPQAVEQGAVAVLAERELELSGDVTQFIVKSTAKAMQEVVPYFYDYPAQKMRMIGVTGTNGKTTVTHMIAHILEKAGHKTGIIGTVHVVIDGVSEPVHNTTPDVDHLQNILARMQAVGTEYVLMEVSSHALELGRVAGCEFDTAVFTNLTQDHLDFHGSMEAYGQAKAKLFAGVAKGGVKKGKAAVINSDDPHGLLMREAAQGDDCRVLTYGTKGQESLFAKDILVNALGSSFTLVHEEAEYPVHIHAMGMFNIYNALAAIGACYAEGVGMPEILAAMADFKAVPGRFERVDEGQDFAVVVDYAHTPDGLENILKTAKEITDGKVLITFGCGGDRDRTKRPIMGELASRYADVVIVTSDNPRTEDPEQIAEEVYAGALQNKGPHKILRKEVNRAEAIAKIIEMAQSGDIVLIAGKGHEDYQILKDKTIHFDDREQARNALRR